MNCKNCGIRLNDNWEKCPACGSEIEREKICAACGNKFAGDLSKCPSCGKEVGEKKPESVEQKPEDPKIEEEELEEDLEDDLDDEEFDDEDFDDDEDDEFEEVEDLPADAEPIATDPIAEEAIADEESVTAELASQPQKMEKNAEPLTVKSETAVNASNNSQTQTVNAGRGQSKPVYSAPQQYNTRTNNRTGENNNIEMRGKHQAYFKGQEGSAYEDFVYNVPMKWYQFLVYFLLWATSVVYFIGAIGTLRPILMGQKVPSDDTLICLGFSFISSVALGIYSILVRQKLIGRKSNAANGILILYAADIVVAVINAYLTLAMYDVSSPIATLLATIFVDVLMIVLNNNYFKKRKDYFVY